MEMKRRQDRGAVLLGVWISYCDFLVDDSSTGRNHPKHAGLSDIHKCLSH
jgi:hypothetical protein